MVRIEALPKYEDRTYSRRHVQKEDIPDRPWRIGLLVAALALALAACGILDPDEPGNLVPKTVVEDPLLPRTAVNGTLLHSETFGDPVNPMILVLHGGPRGDYRPLLALRDLAIDGFYVVFWDQRDSGLSERHEADSYSLDMYLEDLRPVIGITRPRPTSQSCLSAIRGARCTRRGSSTSTPSASTYHGCRRTCKRDSTASYRRHYVHAPRAGSRTKGAGNPATTVLVPINALNDYMHIRRDPTAGFGRRRHCWSRRCRRAPTRDLAMRRKEHHFTLLEDGLAPDLIEETKGEQYG